MKKFQIKTAIWLTLPALGLLVVGIGFSRASRKNKPPFVVLNDEFTRSDSKVDGYAPFDHLVVVRFRRNSGWDELFTSQKSAWCVSINEVATSTKTKRKLEPGMGLAFNGPDDPRQIAATREFWGGYDADDIDKVQEPLLFETTISWTEGRNSTLHSTTIKHWLSPQQRRQIKALRWNTKTKQMEDVRG